MSAHYLGSNIWKIARGGHEIVGERPGEQLTVLVVNQMLEERATKTLNDRTDDLAMQHQRIDDPAAILHRHIVDEVYMTGLGIDPYMGGVRAVAPGVLVV